MKQNDIIISGFRLERVMAETFEPQISVQTDQVTVGCQTTFLK